MKEQVRLAKARVDSYARMADDKTMVASSLADSGTKEKLRLVVKPPNPSKALKEAGVILLLTPDPITAVPGTALLCAGYLMKKREPLSLASVLDETRKTMLELQSIL